MSRKYCRVIPGKGHVYFAEVKAGGYIGTDFNLRVDLSNNLPDKWTDFNIALRPAYLEGNPGKSRISAGMALGSIWTLSKWMRPGDVVVVPDGTGQFLVGEIEGEYFYVPAGPLPHRRAVQWYDRVLSKETMSEALQATMSTPQATCDLHRYAAEIESLISGSIPTHTSAALSVSDLTVEDPSAFALEKHLEDFLVVNWSKTPLGSSYEIFSEDAVLVGQQYSTDTGPIDILAISKDKKSLLVVELKKGRASDAVVGQILRYMGYIKDQVAEDGQLVEGVIIALEDDQRLKRALSIVPSVTFYRYEVNFSLKKAALQ
jgi:restriction system protein